MNMGDMEIPEMESNEDDQEQIENELEEVIKDNENNSENNSEDCNVCDGHSKK